jgi:hypothetical protein
MRRKPNVIELQPLVACLKGHEDVNPGPIVRRLTRKFYHKSGSELRFEQEQQVKLLTIGNLSFGNK